MENLNTEAMGTKHPIKLIHPWKSVMGMKVVRMRRQNVIRSLLFIATFWIWVSPLWHYDNIRKCPFWCNLKSNLDSWISAGLLEQPIVVEGKRQRKKTERLSEKISAEQEIEIKEKEKDLVITKGKGVCLSEIAYIQYMVNKSKADDLKLLYRLLFGKLSAVRILTCLFRTYLQLYMSCFIYIYIFSTKHKPEHTDITNCSCLFGVNKCITSWNQQQIQTITPCVDHKTKLFQIFNNFTFLCCVYLQKSPKEMKKNILQFSGFPFDEESKENEKKLDIVSR